MAILNFLWNDKYFSEAASVLSLKIKKGVLCCTELKNWYQKIVLAGTNCVDLSSSTFITIRIHKCSCNFWWRVYLLAFFCLVQVFILNYLTAACWQNTLIGTCLLSVTLDRDSLYLGPTTTLVILTVQRTMQINLSPCINKKSAVSCPHCLPNFQLQLTTHGLTLSVTTFCKTQHLYGD